MMDGAKCMPGGLLVFLTAESRSLIIDDAVLFCFIRPRLKSVKSALSVVREENDGAARRLICVNK